MYSFIQERLGNFLKPVGTIVISKLEPLQPWLNIDIWCSGEYFQQQESK